MPSSIGIIFSHSLYTNKLYMLGDFVWKRCIMSYSKYLTHRQFYKEVDLFTVLGHQRNEPWYYHFMFKL